METLSPIDRLTDPTECLKLLKEMSPKDRTHIESIEKTEGILRLYEKTIDLLECAKIDAESTGNRVAQGMTLEEIENQISVQLCRKLELEDAVLFETQKLHCTINSFESPAKSEKKDFKEIKCNNCKTINVANIYNTSSDCHKCGKTLFDSNVDSDEDGLYKQVNCQHCNTKNNADVYKPDSKCHKCNQLLFGDAPTQKNVLKTFMEIECKNCASSNNINIYDHNAKCKACNQSLFGGKVNQAKNKNYITIDCEFCDNSNNVDIYNREAKCSECRELFFSDKVNLTYFLDIGCSHCLSVSKINVFDNQASCDKCKSYFFSKTPEMELVSGDDDWYMKMTCPHCKMVNTEKTYRPDSQCRNCSQLLFASKATALLCPNCQKKSYVSDLDSYAACSKCGCVLIDMPTISNPFEEFDENSDKKGKEKVKEFDENSDKKGKEKVKEFDGNYGKNIFGTLNSSTKDRNRNAIICPKCESKNDESNILCCVCNKSLFRYDLKRFELKNPLISQTTEDASYTIPQTIKESPCNFLRREPLKMTHDILDAEYYNKKWLSSLISSDKHWNTLQQYYDELQQTQKDYVYQYLVWFANIHTCIMAKEMYIYNTVNRTVYGLKVMNTLKHYTPGTHWLTLAVNKFETLIKNKTMYDVIMIVGSNDDIVLTITVEENRLKAEGSMNFYYSKPIGQQPVTKSIPNYIA